MQLEMMRRKLAPTDLGYDKKDQEKMRVLFPVLPCHLKTRAEIEKYYKEFPDLNEKE